MQASVPDLYKKLSDRFPHTHHDYIKLKGFYPEATEQMIQVAHIVGNAYCDVRARLGEAYGNDTYRFRQIQEMVIDFTNIARGHTPQRYEVFRSVVQGVDNCLEKSVIDTYAEFSGYVLVWKERVDDGKLEVSKANCLKKACGNCPPCNDKFWAERKGKQIN